MYNLNSHHIVYTSIDERVNLYSKQKLIPFDTTACMDSEHWADFKKATDLFLKGPILSLKN